MTTHSDWRPMSSDEADLIRAIVSHAGIRPGEPIVSGLDGAEVMNTATWILDVRTSDIGRAADLPNGPFPARAFVPNSTAYRGEVIIWITNGRVSGLEYAWITDEPPTRWPYPDELEVVVVQA